MGRTGNERGMALAAAVFALVIIAALITGVFFAARQEMRIGENTLTAQRAFDAADAGVQNAISNWRGASWNLMAVNTTLPDSGTLPSGQGSWAGTVRRLNDNLFVLQMTGRDKYAQSTRTVGVLMKLRKLYLDIRGAVTTQNALTIGGSSQITGVNSNPTNWVGCPAATDSLPGIATADSSQITVQGGSINHYVQGDPAVLNDTTITDSTFLKFGDLTYNDLAAMATITFTSSLSAANIIYPVGTATTCNAAVQTNWGDPDPAISPYVAGCVNYFPFIHVMGDLTAQNGKGQGILLVDGNVYVQGNFEFFGPVIVRGTLTTQGNGNHFSGGVMAANINLSTNTVLGNAEVSYSSCAVARALTMNATGRRLGQRSWLDLF